MSIINECLENDPIYIIQNFVGCEDGIDFVWEKSVKFNIEDKVYYIDEYKDLNLPNSQDHLSWKIKFKTEDGKFYSSNQLYFVTEDQWLALKDFFENK